MLITLDLSKWAISEMTITELDGTPCKDEKLKRYFDKKNAKLVFPHLILTLEEDELVDPAGGTPYCGWYDLKHQRKLNVTDSLLPLTVVKLAIEPSNFFGYMFMGKITNFLGNKLVFHTFNYWYRERSLGINDYNIGEKIVELSPVTLETWNKYKDNFIMFYNKETSEQEPIPTFNNDEEMQNWFWLNQYSVLKDKETELKV